MKKITLAVLIMIITVSAFGCADASEMDIPKVMPSETDYTAELDINSPEWLAKESSEIYKGLINKEITIEDGFNRLLDISCEQAAHNMLKYKEKFENQIVATIDYFESENDSIIRYDFAQTEHDENTASIKRIQIQKNGNKYYFKQDFIKEVGVWRIKGDNIENKFELKQRFLFWLI